MEYNLTLSPKVNHGPSKRLGEMVIAGSSASREIASTYLFVSGSFFNLSFQMSFGQILFRPDPDY